MGLLLESLRCDAWFRYMYSVGKTYMRSIKLVLEAYYFIDTQNWKTISKSKKTKWIAFECKRPNFLTIQLITKSSQLKSLIGTINRLHLETKRESMKMASFFQLCRTFMQTLSQLVVVVVVFFYSAYAHSHIVRVSIVRSRFSMLYVMFLFLFCNVCLVVKIVCWIVCVSCIFVSR